MVNKSINAKVRFLIKDMSVESFYMNNLRSLNEILMRDDSNTVISTYQLKGGFLAFTMSHVIQFQLAMCITGREKTSKKNIEIARMECSYDYQIFGFEHLFDANGNIVIKEKMAQSFTNIAHHSTRGILYEKFNASILGSFILPPLDSQDMPKGDITIEKEKIH